MPFNFYVTQTLLAMMLQFYLMKCISNLKFNLVGIHWLVVILIWKCTQVRILCFMVVSLKKSIPFVISAVPIVKNSGDIVYGNLDKCLLLLTQSRFRIRAIVSDNHSTNVNAYTRLLMDYKVPDKDYKIINPYLPDKYIYLLFDTCHLIKNIRNNLVANKFFDIPSFHFSSVNINISFQSGFVRWSHFHTIHEKDLSLSAHLRAANKINYSVLHPGNNKQSVSLALAIFHESTISALRLYLPKEEVTPGFLNLIRIWWLSVNSKERFHPFRQGNALVSNALKQNSFVHSVIG